MADNRDGPAATYSLRSLGTGALQAAAGNHTHGGAGGPATDLASATTTINIGAATAPSAGQVLQASSSTAASWVTLGAGSGDFVGPAASTDNAVVRFDATTGKLGQNSVVLIGDTGIITGGQWAGTSIAVAYLGSGTPSAGKYLDGAGTWTTLPSGANAITVAVDFGATFGCYAETVVTGQAWVTATSAIAVTPQGAAGDEIETALHGFSAVITDRVVGTGFTLRVYAAVEAKGSYNFSCVGV